MIFSILQKIPLAIAGILIAVAVIRIYFRAKNVTKGEFFKFFKTAKFISIRIVAFVMALMVAFGIFNHLKAKQSVKAVISLNYSEASMAQNSNGTRYNMAEIICDEVVERAIKKGAFQDVTVKQLKQCLCVYPYMQGNVDDKSNYHISTEFVVEYHASRHTDHLDAENVILLIAGAYKEYYIEKYTDKFSIRTEDEKPDYSQMEYMDIVAYFNKETNAILNYLYGMAQKGPSFATENHTTFLAIAGKVQQFQQVQIEQNLRSLILQNGVIRNREDYVDRLTYQNKSTDFDTQKHSASFRLCNDAIKMYAEEMTRVVLVPTWDESGKYYMGRTKVGIDELSVMATNYSDQVASGEKQMMNNNLVIEKINTATGAEGATAQVDELISSIDKTIDDFAVEAISAGREYSNYRMNQCIAVSISGSSLLSELKSIAIFTMLSYIAVLLYTISKKFPKKA